MPLILPFLVRMPAPRGVCATTTIPNSARASATPLSNAPRPQVDLRLHHIKLSHGGGLTDDFGIHLRQPDSTDQTLRNHLSHCFHSLSNGGFPINSTRAKKSTFFVPAPFRTLTPVASAALRIAKDSSSETVLLVQVNPAANFVSTAEILSLERSLFSRGAMYLRIRPKPA